MSPPPRSFPAAASQACSEIGGEPALSPVGSGLEPASAGRLPVSERAIRAGKRFSLWNDRQSRLFTDPRALSPGDILTVRIEINDRARFKNKSDRSRTAAARSAMT